MAACVVFVVGPSTPGVLFVFGSRGFGFGCSRVRGGSKVDHTDALGPCAPPRREPASPPPPPLPTGPRD
eukprot:scaffold25498_cov84-Isochrysis_galbana.AAC.2